jgi:hypothetical protein
VVGAGAEVLDGERTLVRLAAIRPNKPSDPSTQGGSVTAFAESANRVDTYDWSLRAHAVCASAAALPGYQVVSHAVAPSSRAFQQTSARCPTGYVTYGSGGLVQSSPGHWGTNGKAWLQLYRTSQPLDIARTTGRAMPGFDGRWQVFSYAICASWQNQLFADGTIAQSSDATDRCFTGFTHGLGGGGGLSDGGPVWLDEVRPHADLMGVDVSLTGPLNPAIGGMVAHETCAF